MCWFTIEWTNIWGSHPAGGSRGTGPLPIFRYSPNCALKFLNPFKRNALKNQYQKQKNPTKRCAKSNLLKIFQRYFKNYTKAWFSPVRLIYSHYFLHNIISNCTGVNAHFSLHWVKRKSLFLIAWEYFTSKRTRQLPCVMKVKL